MSTRTRETLEACFESIAISRTFETPAETWRLLGWLSRRHPQWRAAILDFALFQWSGEDEDEQPSERGNNFRTR